MSIVKMVVGESDLSIVIEDPATQNIVGSNQPNFRPRRYHNKSRNGCIICKRRRIKCDEARPECNYCWEKGIRCRYTAPRGSPPITDKSHGSIKVAPINLHGSFTKSLEMEALQALERQHIPCADLKDAVYKRSDALELLHNFVETTDTTWIGSSKCQSNMQKHCLRLAFEASYLLHAILAYSAAFLNSKYPEEKKYRIAATLHYQRSLQHFHRHLDTELQESDADAMMASSILLSMLSFVHTSAVDEQERASNAPSWIRPMQGTQILVQTPVLRRGLLKGIWSKHVQAFDDWKSQIFGHYLDLSRRSTEDVAQVRAFGCICSTAPVEQQELFKTPIFMLEHLAQLPPNIEVGRRFIYFMAMLPNEFIDLLNAEDPFAMLTIAFWCAFLSRLDQWWITNSAIRECRRICWCIKRLDDCRFNSLTRYLLEICSSSK